MTLPAQSAPAEVQLLLLLCRHPAEQIDKREAARVCAQVGDWAHFLHLARHHRVLPLVAKNAASAPLPTSTVVELHAYAARNAVEAFRSLAETRRLLDLLAGGGIEATVLKGIPLSLLAFGDVGTRDVGDIDLLVRPQDAEATDRLLQPDFLRLQPAGKLTPRRRASYARHFKDYTYEPLSMVTTGGFEVDLHWRLFRNPRIPGNSPALLQTETIHVGALAVKMLSPPAQLLYLAVLGTLDGWTRFKAVADIAALWHKFADPGPVLALADATATTPYLHAALMLAETWIGDIDLPPPLDRKPGALARNIAARAQSRMQAAAHLPELRETSSWAMKRYEASLCRTAAYKWELGKRVLFRPRVWDRFDLPDTLFPLYPLLSPLEWLLFHLPGARKRSA